MNVHFFVCSPKDGVEGADVKRLARAFGPEHPKYSGPLEGCRGAHYLFCLNIDLDTIIQICETYDFEISGLYENTATYKRNAFFAAEVDSKLYNPEYTALHDRGAQQMYMLGSCC